MNKYRVALRTEDLDNAPVREADTAEVAIREYIEEQNLREGTYFYRELGPIKTAVVWIERNVSVDVNDGDGDPEPDVVVEKVPPAATPAVPAVPAEKKLR